MCKRCTWPRISLEHAIYPYLLRDRTIERGNEVWAMDRCQFRWQLDPQGCT
jgi:hypothetical protein